MHPRRCGFTLKTHARERGRNAAYNNARLLWFIFNINCVILNFVHLLLARENSSSVHCEKNAPRIARDHIVHRATRLDRANFTYVSLLPTCDLYRVYTFFIVRPTTLRDTTDPSVRDVWSFFKELRQSFPIRKNGSTRMLLPCYDITRACYYLSIIDQILLQILPFGINLCQMNLYIPGLGGTVCTYWPFGRIYILIP